MNSIDIGGATGIGLGIAVGPGSIFLEARYTFGFMNVDNAGTPSGYMTGHDAFKGVYPTNKMSIAIVNVAFG